MKYIVCWNLSGETEIEAESPEEASKKFTSPEKQGDFPSIAEQEILESVQFRGIWNRLEVSRVREFE